jgi:predicted nucleotidyltransferase
MSTDAIGLELRHLADAVERVAPPSTLFVTVGGAHLYGFPSADSDVDLRGAHLLPIERVIGLRRPQVTHKASDVCDGAEVDFVSHDLAECLRLLVGKNGYILEQILSPHVVVAWPGFEQLRELARAMLSRSLYHHYRGWARGRWKVFASEEPKRVKTLLYAYRVLLAGTHLLETGEVESSLPRLARDRDHGPIVDLIGRRRTGERLALEREEVERHAQRFSELERALLQAYTASTLPDAPVNVDEIERFLIETRLQTWGSADTQVCARTGAGD